MNLLRFPASLTTTWPCTFRAPGVAYCPCQGCIMDLDTLKTYCATHTPVGETVNHLPAPKRRRTKVKPRPAVNGSSAPPS